MERAPRPEYPESAARAPPTDRPRAAGAPPARRPRLRMSYAASGGWQAGLACVVAAHLEQGPSRSGSLREALEHVARSAAAAAGKGGSAAAAESSRGGKRKGAEGGDSEGEDESARSSDEGEDEGEGEGEGFDLRRVAKLKRRLSRWRRELSLERAGNLRVAAAGALGALPALLDALEPLADYWASAKGGVGVAQGALDLQLLCSWTSDLCADLLYLYVGAVSDEESTKGLLARAPRELRALVEAGEPARAGAGKAPSSKAPSSKAPAGKAALAPAPRGAGEAVTMFRFHTLVAPDAVESVLEPGVAHLVTDARARAALTLGVCKRLLVSRDDIEEGNRLLHDPEQGPLALLELCLKTAAARKSTFLDDLEEQAAAWPVAFSLTKPEQPSEELARLMHGVARSAPAPAFGALLSARVGFAASHALIGALEVRAPEDEGQDFEPKLSRAGLAAACLMREHAMENAVQRVEERLRALHDDNGSLVVALSSACLKL